jgi:hypothetical protein
LDPKEISELNKNDVAGFRWKSENPWANDKALGIERGLRQGDALSTALLNTVLEKVIGNIEINMNGTIFKRARWYIAYADDLLILGRSVRAIEVTVTQIKEYAVNNGLEINESKT